MRIQEFQLVRNDTSTAIISNKGITRVTSIAMAQLLRDLANVHMTRQFKALCTVHGIDHAEALAFIENAIGFEAALLEDHYFDVAQYHSYDHEAGHRASWATRACRKLTRLSSQRAETRPNANTLSIYLGEDVMSASFKETYYAQTRDNIHGGVMVGFIDDSVFYLTPPFISTLGNPCFYCITASIFKKRNPDNHGIDWVIKNHFITSHRYREPARFLHDFQMDILTSFTHLQVEKMTSIASSSYQDTVYRVAAIDLKHLETTYFSVPHWHLCCCRRLHASITFK